MKEIYYSHCKNKTNFFKYNANYKQKISKIIIRKYTLDTTQIVDEHVWKTEYVINKKTNLIIFDNLTVHDIFRVFRNESIYHNIEDMLPYVAKAVKNNFLDTKYEMIQDLIDTYPESFI